MKMKYAALLFSVVAVLSCKVTCEDNLSGPELSETHWDLHFKYNPTFTFFAVSHLYFKSDNSVINYRSADTVTGTWSRQNMSIEMNFDNGEKLNGSFITADSLSGTSLVAGNNGTWYANKR